MMTTSNEHNNAPAVPQGDPTEEMLVAGLKECEPLGELIDWREGFGRIEMRAVWEAMLAATPAPAPAQEVATLSLAAEDVHAAFAKNFPKSRISQAWINFAADIAQAIAARAAKPAQGEPFGYFRAEPFGWADCSEDAEGAIALYEHPAKPAQEVGLTDDEIDENTVWHDPDPHDNVHCDVSATVRKCLAALRAKGASE